jgi:hypothetical protein
MQYGRDASNFRASFTSVDRGLHSINHGDSDSLDEWTQNMIVIERFFAEQFAHLALSLDAIPEGDGTLLDNTLLLWFHEQALGRRHDRRDYSFVVAGGRAHGIRTGRKHTFSGEPHNQLLMALCHAMDVDPDGDTFGNPEYRGVISLA